MDEKRIKELANKLRQGSRAYFPPNFENLSMIEKDKLYSKIRELHLADYEEYYEEKFNELLQNFGNELEGSTFCKQSIFYLLENYLRKFEYSETVVNQFEWKLNTDMEDKYSKIYLKCFDCPRNNVNVRMKLYEITFENNELKISLTKNKYITWMEMRT